MCRLTGCLSRWTANGDDGLRGETVHAPVAVELKPVHDSVTVQGIRCGQGPITRPSFPREAFSSRRCTRVRFRALRFARGNVPFCIFAGKTLRAEKIGALSIGPQNPCSYVFRITSFVVVR